MSHDNFIKLAREAGVRAAKLLDEFGTEGALCDSEIQDLRAVERLVQAAYAAGAAAERNKLAAWMIQFGFTTGHGDTMEELVDALGSEVVDRIEFEIDAAVNAEREACAKVCHDASVPVPGELQSDAQWSALCLAAAIRARGKE